MGGVSLSLIKEWSVDPQVTFGLLPIKQSIFDTLEDTDSDYCLALCQMIASFSGEVASRKSSPLEKELEELKEQLTAYEALGQAVAAFQAFTPPIEVASSQPKGKGEGKGATSGASTSKAKRDRKRRNRKDKGDD